MQLTLPSGKQIQIVRSLPSVAPTSKRFNTDVPVEIEANRQTDDRGVVVDYQNVKIRGFLSTFREHTPADRDGDYVVRGAFADTLKTFFKNPIMLRDHSQRTEDAIGQFTHAVETESGLYIEGMLSNSPAVRDLRFKVAEGVLRTLSMGGVFYKGRDGRSIERVDLWEGSIVAIPANPDATFEVARFDISRN